MAKASRSGLVAAASRWFGTTGQQYDPDDQGHGTGGRRDEVAVGCFDMYAGEVDASSGES